MVGYAVQIRSRITSALPCFMMAALITTSLRPGVVRAAPAAPAAVSGLAAFDRGFRAGQDEFNQQRYLEAARVWTLAAGSLPETEEHKENRRAIHEYIAEAYEKAVELGADEAVIREGSSTLDAYAEAFTAAHPADTLPEHVAKTRLAFRTRLAESEAEQLRREEPPEEVRPAPAPAPAREPTRPPPRPWRALAIGGGIAVGGGAATLAMFAAGFARAKSAESKFDDPAHGCDLDGPTGQCAEILRQGKAANGVAVAGLVGAPLLLGAGIALLVVATRRKANQTALVPVFSSNSAGLVWQSRF